MHNLSCACTGSKAKTLLELGFAQVSPLKLMPALVAPMQRILPEDSAEFAVVHKCFVDGLVGHAKTLHGEACETPQLTVSEICSIHAPKLSARYMQKLVELTPPDTQLLATALKGALVVRSFLPVCMNEVLLWHGTHSVAAVTNDGFDMRFTKPGIYGKGHYFSAHASKSDLYTNPLMLTKEVIFTRVNLGKYCRVSERDHTGARVPCLKCRRTHTQ
jgi:hypothetical protein